MKKNSLFIVIEGIDGSGKTTLAKNLTETLNSYQIPTQYFHEPTHFEHGNKIRKFLQGELKLSKKELIDLFLLDRESSVKKNIVPSLQNGSCVILDRYLYSMAAYQGDETYSPFQILEMNLQKNFPLPDLLFFLNIPVQVALLRIQRRGKKQEIFDSTAQLEIILQNYTKILPPNTIYLDAQKNQKELIEECLQHFKEELKLHTRVR